MNQGLHVEYFKTISVEEQMNKLKEVILPKFELTEQYLSELQQEAVSYTHLTLPTICSV